MITRCDTLSRKFAGINVMESIFGVLIYKFAGKNVKVSFFGIFVSVSSYFEQIELFSESKRFSQLLLILQN